MILDRTAPIVPSAEGHWTSRGGLRFAYRVIRHPEPCFTPTMFVSGAFQTMDSWARFARAFAPRTTVVLVDPPGMGDADLLPADIGVEFLAGCLAQVLDEVAIERASIIAASYGTPTGFQLARAHPERVDRIALAGTMRELPAHRLEEIAQSVDAARRGDRELLADTVLGGMLCNDPAKPIERRSLAARVLRAGIVRMSDAELLKYAANTERLLRLETLDLSATVRGPEALVFTGEHDRFTPPPACREVATAFECAWFTTVQRADHLLHIQRWDTTIDLLLRFMARELGPAGLPGCNALEVVSAPPVAAA